MSIIDSEFIFLFLFTSRYKSVIVSRRLHILPQDGLVGRPFSGCGLALGMPPFLNINPFSLANLLPCHCQAPHPTSSASVPCPLR